MTESPSPYRVGAAALSAVQLAAFVDHTVLKPEASADDIDKLCAEARAFRFASVCVNGVWVPRCVAALKDSGVKTCTVIGFPLGATSTAAKQAEARIARADGATELDMVLAVGLLKSGMHDAVRADIAAVVDAARPGALVKVIIETCLLNDDEKRLACTLAVEAGAAFVKTSTGFGKSGATAMDVALMRAAVGPAIGVKASGGVRDRATALAMITAGATRIGTSSGIAIVEGS